METGELIQGSSVETAELIQGRPRADDPGQPRVARSFDPESALVILGPDPPTGLQAAEPSGAATHLRADRS
ncbi:hypothetical protein GCM10010404_25820 [Nonomuraea africana]